MQFGIWFTTKPNVVVSTYLSNDLLVSDIASSFTNINEWKSVTDGIDFCVITVRNYDGNPGNIKYIKEFINKMKNDKISVYLAISCLLLENGGVYRRLRDSDKVKSNNWICPADPNIIKDNRIYMQEICSYYEPTGILLWNATFPSEHFCYGYNDHKKDSKMNCYNCLSKEYSELDIDKRSDILKSFIQKISEQFKGKYRIAMKIDVDGEGNIEYKYGVKLEKLNGIIDEVFFHTHGSDERTLRRVHQLSIKANNNNIHPKLYVGLFHEEHFHKISSIPRNTHLDFLFYSPNKEAIEKMVSIYHDIKKKD
jgi:hypothetical protein